MLFNSLTFLFFFTAVYLLYMLLGRRYKLQNLLLLVAGYVFYGYWDWRFLSLIAISTLTDFSIGRLLDITSDQTPAGKQRRKLLLVCSIIVNLTFLGFFKYFDFFVTNFVALLSLLGVTSDPLMLQIVLPVGISFYTFQTMSYTIDVYRKRLKPTDSLLNFAVFVAFFPQLVAGPIERAANMLPQVENRRYITTEQLNAGFFLVLWGYFKKIVVADNVGLIADHIFNNYTHFAGLDILIGVLAFSTQVYADFSSYSDIARGISRLMGFELLVNFRLPQFSLNPADFWNRWHISLSHWLRDYIFFPLRRVLLRRNRNATVLNLALPPMVTMLASGLWHGPSWTFVLWGAFHGLLLIIYQRFEKHPMHQDPWGGKHSPVVVIAKMVLMFVLAHVGWLIFRSTSIHQIGYMITHVSLIPSRYSLSFIAMLLSFASPLVLVQIHQYVKRDLLAIIKLPILLRLSSYSLMLVWIFVFGAREPLEFIYFQF
ncbi:MAG: MBOAT family protein [Chloroflexi bacterium]|nr:MBOAT family protein [Chloroflexota bacterium]